MRHRVVITGMGVVTPIGSSVADFRERLLAGRSGIGPITQFDPAQLRTRIAAEVKESFPDHFRDRKITFALEAARQAVAEATACGSWPESGPGAGLSLGLGLEVFAMEDLISSRKTGFTLPQSLRERLTFLQTPSDLCVHLIARTYGLNAPPLIHTSACAAGTDAVGTAFHLIRSGRRRWMLAGGTDSMINPLGVGGFCKLGATSMRNEHPDQASRPFDRDRDGFVLGEGAAVMVLERLEDARARGASIHAEIVGYGNSLDAHGISEPHPEGRGAYQAMVRCLDDAGVGPEVIDCVNAHGSSTPKNDVMETLALQRLLVERARQVPVSSIKSMIGHLIAATGAVEVVAAVIGMQSGMVPPTINLDEPDPACDLDHVPHQARHHEQRYVLSNSFGFGGQNAAILLRKGSLCDE